MKTLSLKIDDDTFEETEKILLKVKTNRSRYFIDAVKFYNRIYKRKLLAKQLAKESDMARNESLKVLAEFEALEDEYQTI
ncbi:MAG: hypothetical protein HY960_09790 [Ignavibacteriae bacterium]|nr:hypothetical protein [Ignavibacteriota bacterium]